MKVAIITSGFLPAIDGVTVSVHHRLQQLSQSGHQVVVFCPDYQPIAQIYPDWQNYVGEIWPGVSVVSLASVPFMGMEFERNPSAKSYQTLLQELERFQPDLIHVDEPDRLFLEFGKPAGVDYAKRAGIPCVAFFHTNFLEYMEDYFPVPPIVLAGMKFLAKHLITRRVYNAYDTTLTASQVTEKKLAEIGIKRVVRADLLGVDLEQFQPRQPQFFEQHYGLTQVDDKTKLIFLGRLTPDKGWAFTLEALPLLGQAIDLSTVAILVVGDGPLRDQIVSRLGAVAPHLQLLGRVHPDQIPALLVNSDIHVTTSEKETKGLTILEAFAAGIPAVAPRAGGVIDSIQDGWNGFLFQPGDSKDFVQKLKRLIQDPALRQIMGDRARDGVSPYTWTNAVNNLVTIWKGQIARIKDEG